MTWYAFSRHLRWQCAKVGIRGHTTAVQLPVIVKLLGDVGAGF